MGAYKKYICKSNENKILEKYVKNVCVENNFF